MFGLLSLIALVDCGKPSPMEDGNERESIYSVRAVCGVHDLC